MTAVEVTFRDLTEAEYDAYMAALLPRYAAAVAEAAGMPLEEATASATKQITELLTEGLHTPTHEFHRILDADGRSVGTLWLCTLADLDPPRLYIYDIVIDETARGRGIGTAVLAWIDEEARRRGLAAIGLSVIDSNPARRLYERVGYRADKVGRGGRSMLKRV